MVIYTFSRAMFSFVFPHWEGRVPFANSIHMKSILHSCCLLYSALALSLCLSHYVFARDLECDEILHCEKKG